MMSPFYLLDWRCKPVAASALPQTICISIRPHSREDGDFATKDEQEQRIAVFDRCAYSQANMQSYNDAKIWWISRGPETSTAAKTALEEVDEQQCQALLDGAGDYIGCTRELPQGGRNGV